MPELPDVEGFKRYFARHAKGRRVRAVTVPNPSIVRNSTPQGMGAALRGKKLGPPRRHGKWMVVPADGSALAFHFGMTGLLAWSRTSEDRHRHDRLILCFDGGELRYRNMRMLGGVWLLPGESALEEVSGPLGPDAQDVSAAELRELLSGCRGGIKALLMRQSRIAGIGNELSDEILWKARIHPARGCTTLSRAEQRRLHRAMQSTISTSNRHGRIPTERRWLKSQRREADPRCPRCGTRLKKETIAGRTSFWCPKCQAR